MNKKERLAFAFVTALAMTSGGFAFGQSVNNVSSDQVIYACVTGVNGNITKVSNTPKTCPRGTTPISWNMVGPKGDQGAPGTAVAKGDKGDKGDQGVQGVQGPEGKTAEETRVLLISPQGIEHKVISYMGNDYVEFQDHYWLFSVDVTPMGMNQVSPAELYKSADCTGIKYVLVGRQELWYSPSFAYYTSLDKSLVYPSNKNLNGYAARLSTDQSRDGFLSYKWPNWNPVTQKYEGFLCVRMADVGTASSGNQLMARLNEGYLYELEFIGQAPSVSSLDGWKITVK